MEFNIFEMVLTFALFLKKNFKYVTLKLTGNPAWPGKPGTPYARKQQMFIF